jgi:hypothetical protein
MKEFVMGACALASATIALFFLRFWRQTGDRLFLAFSLSFALLTGSRIGLAATEVAVEERSAFYWVRLAAYLLILVAVLDKNRRPTPRTLTPAPHAPAQPTRSTTIH